MMATLATAAPAMVMVVVDAVTVTTMIVADVDFDARMKAQSGNRRITAIKYL